MKVHQMFVFLLFIIVAQGCAGKRAGAVSGPSLPQVRPQLVDKNATPETAALFYNLQQISREKILFGHQEATRQGYGWNWRSGVKTPDVQEVSGKLPVVFGWDFIDIASFKPKAEVQKVEASVRQHVLQAYRRGGISTFSWHYSNPVSKGSFYWDRSPVEAVAQILPNGPAHETFKNSLKEIAAFTKTLQVDGKLVPIIFRPWHEFDGEWFWWGKGHRSTQEFKELFQFSVTYLRDSLQVRNMLYAWSPDCRFTTEAEFLLEYPGDAYADLVGTDNYWDLRDGKNPAIAAAKFKIVSDFAKAHHKLAAVTESGLLNVTQPDWYTQTLLQALQQQKVELAYVMIWGNRQDEFWTPYKNHPAEQDFLKFLQDPYILTQEKVGNLYELKSKPVYQ